MGIRVDGHGPSGETIAAWKAIRNGQETRYDLQLGKKAGTMTIDVNGHEFEIRENTFLGNEELHGVMVFLSTDLDQQATPSGTPGASSLSTQSLRPQDQYTYGQNEHPGQPIVKPNCGGLVDGKEMSCADAPHYLDVEEGWVSAQCGDNTGCGGDLDWLVDFATRNDCVACTSHMGRKDEVQNLVNLCEAGTADPCY
jgi:hypothetical protein